MHKFDSSMDKEIKCLRCNTKLHYLGIYQFHEGKRYGALGNLMELLVRKRSFGVYECPKCGKAEFYTIK